MEPVTAAGAYTFTEDGRLLLEARPHPLAPTKVGWHACTPAAKRLLEWIRAPAAEATSQTKLADAAFSHVRVLSEAALPPPPQALREYMKVCALEGIVAGAAVTYGDEVLTVPERLTLFMSGERARALRFRDASLAEFVALLFTEIMAHAEGCIRLDPTDLYHGHVFMTVDDWQGGDENADRQAVDLGILFHAKEFPMEWRLSRWAEWHPVGDDEAGGCDGDPRFGTECSVKDASYPLRNLIWLSSTNEIYQLDARAAAFDLPSSRDEFCTVPVTAFDTWPLGDINYFPAHSQEVYCCPRFAFGETLQIAELCAGGSQDIAPEVEKLAILAEDDAAELLGWLAKPLDEEVTLLSGARALRARVQPEVWAAVHAGLAARAARRAEELRVHNSKEAARMLKAGVDKFDADVALEATAVAGRYSEMRASSLLQLTSMRHRSAVNAERFGRQEYGTEEAAAVLLEAIWTENAFVALELMHTRGISREVAVQQAIAEAAEQTEQQIEEQLADHRRAQDARGKAP